MFTTQSPIKRNEKPEFIVDSHGDRHRIIEIASPGTTDKLLSIAAVAHRLGLPIETIEARQRSGWAGNWGKPLPVYWREVLERDSLGRIRKIRFIRMSHLNKAIARRPGETADRFRDETGRWMLTQGAAAIALLGHGANGRFKQLGRQLKLSSRKLRSPITGHRTIAFYEQDIKSASKSLATQAQKAQDKKSTRLIADQHHPDVLIDPELCSRADAKGDYGFDRQALWRLTKAEKITVAGEGRHTLYVRDELQSLAAIRDERVQGSCLVDAAKFIKVPLDTLRRAAAACDPILGATRVVRPGKIMATEWRVTNANLLEWKRKRDQCPPTGWLSHHEIGELMAGQDFRAYQRLHTQLRDARALAREGQDFVRSKRKGQHFFYNRRWAMSFVKQLDEHSPPIRDSFSVKSRNAYFLWLSERKGTGFFGNIPAIRDHWNHLEGIPVSQKIGSNDQGYDTVRKGIGAARKERQSRRGTNSDFFWN